MTYGARASISTFIMATGFGSCLGLSSFSPPAFAQQSICASIPAMAPGLAGVELGPMREVAAENGQPAHCLIAGTLDKRIGSDGRSYAIGFEMRFPANWNNRFLHQVNGGNDGAIVPALGGNPPFSASGGRSPLSMGFAVLSSDSGHSGQDPANKEMGLAAGAAFGLDPQARSDYGYSADRKLAPVGKALVSAYYGRMPKYSYMAGCSNGGRHAMVDASRMPEAYDGFLIGHPGFNLPKAAVQHAWDLQNFQKIDADIRKSITRDDEKLISTRIVEACDRLDGVADGLTSNVRACQKAFDFSSLQCKTGETNACLSPVKTEALKAIFAGPRNSKGEQLYSDWPVDGGVGTGNWRMWKLESPIAAWDNFPTITVMGSSSLAMIFTTPPTKINGVNADLIDYLRRFDFDRDAPKIYARDSVFQESAMDFMAPPDAADPHLNGLRQSGHKALIYHGQADPVFSFNDTANWYDKLDANSGGKAQDFARFFAVPGVTHCGGGMGLDRFDALSALTDWVENGKTPDRITAIATPANRDIPANWSAERSRPLCPWPSYAKYREGDVEKESSFICEKPQVGMEMPIALQ